MERAWPADSMGRGAMGDRSGCLLGLVEMPPDGLGGFAGDYGGERFGGGLPHVAEAAEVGEQALAGLRAYAGDVQKL